MAKFNPFDFLKNRTRSIPPSQEELDNFEPFMTQMALSMASGMEKVLENINTEAFFKLSKKQQCLMYTALDGYNLYGVWQKAKKKDKEAADKTLKEKIIKLFNCSDHQADNYLKYKLLDIDRLEGLYQQIYEPETIKVEKTKKKAKKKSD